MSLSLVLPDIHIEDPDPETLALVMKFAKAHKSKWDEVILLGDLLDFDAISRFNENKPRETWGKTLAVARDKAREFLEGLRTATGDCPIVYLEGNHEARLGAYVDAHPELDGLLDVESLLDFKGSYYLRSWSKGEHYYKNDAVFMHGQSTTKNHAGKHADLIGHGGIYYGHTHQVQSFGKVMLADGQTVRSASLGCLSNLRPKYMLGRATNWEQAFGVCHFYHGGHAMQIVRIQHSPNRPPTRWLVSPLNGKVYDSTTR